MPGRRRSWKVARANHSTNDLTTGCTIRSRTTSQALLPRRSAYRRAASGSPKSSPTPSGRGRRPAWQPTRSSSGGAPPRREATTDRSGRPSHAGRRAWPGSCRAAAAARRTVGAHVPQPVLGEQPELIVEDQPVGLQQHVCARAGVVGEAGQGQLLGAGAAAGAGPPGSLPAPVLPPPSRGTRDQPIRLADPDDALDCTDALGISTDHLGHRLTPARLSRRPL